MSDLFDSDVIGDVAEHSASPGVFDPQMMRDVATGGMQSTSALAKWKSPDADPLEIVGTLAGGTVGSVAGGIRGLWDVMTGQGGEKAAKDVESTQQAFMPKQNPETQRFFADPMNPASWLSDLAAGGRIVAEKAGASPQAAGAIESGVQAAPLVLGLAKTIIPKGAPAIEAPPEAEGMAGAKGGSVGAAAADGGAVVKGEADPLGAPVEGGLPESAHDARAQTLARIGLGNMRESAKQGDAGSAAVDYQLTKFKEEAAGQAASEQFQSEKQALANHVEKLIGDAGGTVGTEQDALIRRGKTIAQPFDMLRDYMDQKRTQLYEEANKRASGTPLTNLDSVDQLLNNRSFRNTLAAGDKQGLLTAVKDQLEFFRENNPQGFTAQTAEQFRQWLNSIWNHENKGAVGQLKDAVDLDISKVGGADLYNQARAMHQMRTKVFDETRGVSKLFGVDDRNPINRNTEYENIPDRISSLGSGQFKYLIDLLKGMPEQLQPDAQAALGEIKGHMLNKVLDAGVGTRNGVPSQVWGTDRVNTFLKNNADTLSTVLSDDPEIMAGLKDARDAGNILRVDQSYPGAYAQATQAIKRGVFPRVVQRATATVGAGIGGAVGGPLGAAGGGAAGEALGASMAGKMSEAAALKKWQKRIVKTPSTEQ